MKTYRVTMRNTKSGVVFNVYYRADDMESVREQAAKHAEFAHYEILGIREI